MLEHVPAHTRAPPWAPMVQPQAQDPSFSTAIEIVKELGYSDGQIDRALGYLGRKGEYVP